MIKLFYYDGHRPFPTQSLEEIEKELEELRKKDECLTDWPEIH